MSKLRKQERVKNFKELQEIQDRMAKQVENHESTAEGTSERRKLKRTKRQRNIDILNILKPTPVQPELTKQRKFPEDISGATLVKVTWFPTQDEEDESILDGPQTVGAEDLATLKESSMEELLDSIARDLGAYSDDEESLEDEECKAQPPAITKAPPKAPAINSKAPGKLSGSHSLFGQQSRTNRKAPTKPLPPIPSAAAKLKTPESTEIDAVCYEDSTGNKQFFI